MNSNNSGTALSLSHLTLPATKCLEQQQSQTNTLIVNSHTYNLHANNTTKNIHIQRTTRNSLTNAPVHNTCYYTACRREAKSNPRHDDVSRRHRLQPTDAMMELEANNSKHQFNCKL